MLTSAQDWEARLYRNAETQRCIARALHPAVLEGDVLWVAPSEQTAFGYLAVDSRFFPLGGEAIAEIDDQEMFPLDIGLDGFAYSRAQDAEALLGALRQGLEMTLQLEPNREEPQRLRISLLGFTRSSNAALAACAETG